MDNQRQWADSWGSLYSKVPFRYFPPSLWCHSGSAVLRWFYPWYQQGWNPCAVNLLYRSGTREEGTVADQGEEAMLEVNLRGADGFLGGTFDDFLFRSKAETKDRSTEETSTALDAVNRFSDFVVIVIFLSLAEHVRTERSKKQSQEKIQHLFHSNQMTNRETFEGLFYEPLDCR